jgi:uncharacterized protein
MDSETSGQPDAQCAQCGAALRSAALFCARCGRSASPLPPEAQAVAEPVMTLTVDRGREMRTVAWLYGLLLLTSLCFGIAYHNEPDGDFDPWMILVDGIIVLGFAGYYWKEIVALLRPSSLDGNAGKKLAIATAVQFVVLGAVFYLMEKTGIPFERITDAMVRHDYGLWQLLALYSLAPAVIEEIAFRGILYERLRLVLGEKEGWLVQAAFFSILHLSPVIFLTHFAMGLIFGWLRMRTGSLIPGMILHAAWNAAVILLELYR